MTQWRTSMAGPTGLDYTAVQTVITIRAPDDPVDAFDRLQIMERAYLHAIRERT